MYHATNKELKMLQILTNMFMTTVQHMAPPAATHCQLTSHLRCS